MTPAVNTAEVEVTQTYRLVQKQADRNGNTGVHALLGNKTTRWALLVGSLLLGSAVVAQQSQQPFASDSPSALPPTAEEVLQALRNQRPQNRVIEPASALERVGKPVTQEPLYPEGASVVDSTGRVVRGERFWILLPDTPDESGTLPAPIKLLPNAVLEGIVAASKNATNSPSFKISGEMTVHDNQNYLLARVSTRATAPRQTKPSRVTPSVATDASTDDIFSAFGAVEAGPSTMPLRAARETLAGGSVVVLPDGTPLIRRPGRIIRDGDWWTFVFESSSAESFEQPLRLLPNKNLELMVSASQGSTSGVVLIVSGEVTAFKQRNYLLVRAATRRINAGNLRK